MMKRELKQKITAWRNKVGRKEAEIRLISEGLSLSIVQKILCGAYKHQPTGLVVRAIEKALSVK